MASTNRRPAAARGRYALLSDPQFAGLLHRAEQLAEAMLRAGAVFPVEPNIVHDVPGADDQYVAHLAVGIANGIRRARFGPDLQLWWQFGDSLVREAEVGWWNDGAGAQLTLLTGPDGKSRELFFEASAVEGLLELLACASGETRCDGSTGARFADGWLALGDVSGSETRGQGVRLPAALVPQIAETIRGEVLPLARRWLEAAGTAGAAPTAG